MSVRAQRKQRHLAVEHFFCLCLLHPCGKLYRLQRRQRKAHRLRIADIGFVHGDAVEHTAPRPPVRGRVGRGDRAVERVGQVAAGDVRRERPAAIRYAKIFYPP